MPIGKRKSIAYLAVIDLATSCGVIDVSYSGASPAGLRRVLMNEGDVFGPEDPDAGAIHFQVGISAFMIRGGSDGT